MIDISICCTTYNHEKYIENALLGMINQKGNFSMEILIHDDASCDNTKNIIKKYAEQYPDIIKPILQVENQYSKDIPINETFNFSRAKGKYIALCEGDDYWIDEYKLQKQFDYMEKNSDCSFCFTNAIIKDLSNKKEDRQFIPYYKEEEKYYSQEDCNYYLGDILKLSFIPTASFMFRTEDYNTIKEELLKPFPYGDLRFKLLFTSLGYARFINSKTCVYRENVPNSALALWSFENRKKAFTRYMQAIDFFKSTNASTFYTYNKEFEEEIKKYSNFAIEYTTSFSNFKNEHIKNAYKKSSFFRKLKIIIKILIRQM